MRVFSFCHGDLSVFSLQYFMRILAICWLVITCVCVHKRGGMRVLARAWEMWWHVRGGIHMGCNSWAYV